MSEGRISYLSRVVTIRDANGNPRKAWIVGRCVVLKKRRDDPDPLRRWLAVDPTPGEEWLAETAEKREAFRLATERSLEMAR